MTQRRLIEKLTASAGKAVIGGICGVMLAAMGSLISTPIGASVAIVFATVVGGCIGRVAGVILGGIYGVLIVATASLLSDSVLGVFLTIVACTLIGGWLGWPTKRTDMHIPSGEDSRRCDSNEVTTVPSNTYHHEELLCN